MTNTTNTPEWQRFMTAMGQPVSTDPKAPTIDEPSENELIDMVLSGTAIATDGCSIEIDNTCPHGHTSWLAYLGII